ncbi:MAG TPA: glycosyltransferase family 39 protein [Solirubrobacterales bacterium]|nr:glycosyltransferase family 39 protein [Solirubrobacterales bacterium]
MKGLAARNGGRVGLAALVAILLLGLGLRIDNAWQGRAPVYDAAAYATIAANLERGDGFTLGSAATQPASDYSPGLPLLVSGLYELTGGVHERLARLALALIGSLAVLFAYLIGRRLSGPLAGLIGAAAVAIYPALLEYQGMLMGEPLAASLLSGAVLAMLWAAGPVDSARVKWLVPGLLLGALALTRPEYLAISLPMAVVVFARQGWDGWQEGLIQALVLLVGLAVVVAPWTVRNEVALGRFVPISTGGGQVLFAGSYVPSGGDPEKVGAEVLKRHPELRAELPPDPRLEQILAALARQRYPNMENDAALARMGRERLWEDVSEHPVEYAGFAASKLWLTWGHGPRDVMRQPVWAVLHWLLLAFGLLGLAVLARRRRWEALLLGTILLAVAAVGLLLVASPRRTLVAIPLLAALSGAGVAWLRTCTGPRRSA